MDREPITAYISFSVFLCAVLFVGCSTQTTTTSEIQPTSGNSPPIPTATSIANEAPPLVETRSTQGVASTPSPVTPTDAASGTTVIGRVVLGYGSHSPVADLPLWIGKESQGEPTTRTKANGEFTLTNFPVGQVVDVVNNHLAFQVPITSSGTIDLGILKYPLIHPPVYYWQTPEPLPSLSTLLSQGQPVQFAVCQTDTAWHRPTEQEQREQVWTKRPFSDKGERFLRHWFQQPAVMYDTADIFVQSFPGGPRLDDIGADWRYLLGLWTSEGFSLSDSECAYGPQELEELLARRKIEVWLLNYQVNSVRQFGEHFAVEATPSPGFQIVRFAGNEGPIAVHIVANNREIVQLPKHCGSPANPGCSD